MPPPRPHPDKISAAPRRRDAPSATAPPRAHETPAYDSLPDLPRRRSVASASGQQPSCKFALRPRARGHGGRRRGRGAAGARAGPAAPSRRRVARVVAPPRRRPHESSCEARRGAQRSALARGAAARPSRSVELAPGCPARRGPRLAPDRRRDTSGCEGPGGGFLDPQEPRGTMGRSGASGDSACVTGSGAFGEFLARTSVAAADAGRSSFPGGGPPARSDRSLAPNALSSGRSPATHWITFSLVTYPCSAKPTRVSTLRPTGEHRHPRDENACSLIQAATSCAGKRGNSIRFHPSRPSWSSSPGFRAGWRSTPRPEDASTPGHESPVSRRGIRDVAAHSGLSDRAALIPAAVAQSREAAGR